MEIRSEFTCPSELAHDTVKGKWKLIIIFSLRKGSYSFSNLLHSIEETGQKTLLEKLKELKQFGLVGKKPYVGYPLKVEYFLIDIGLKMLSAVEMMQDIGIKYTVKHRMPEILDERGICYRRYARKSK